MKNRLLTINLSVVCLLASSLSATSLHADWSGKHQLKGYNPGFGDFPPRDIDQKLFGHLNEEDELTGDDKTTASSVEQQSAFNPQVLQSQQNQQLDNYPAQSYPAQSYSGQNTKNSAAYEAFKRNRDYARSRSQRNNRGTSFSGPWNNRGGSYSSPWNNRGGSFSGPWNNNGSSFSGPWNNSGSGFSGPWNNGSRNNGSNFSMPWGNGSNSTPWGNGSGWSW